MPPTVKSYTPKQGSGLSGIQTGGIWQEMRFAKMVTELVQTGTGILQEAMDAAGISAGDPSANYPGLSCIGIHPRMHSKGKVIIDYVFKRASYDSVLYLGSGFHINAAYFQWSGSSSLTQHETLTDLFGDPIVVSHLWKAGDEDPMLPIGQTSFSVAAVSVSVASSVLIGRGFLQTSYPDVIADTFQGYVNSDIWAGKPPGTWQCTHVEWEPSATDSSPVTFQFLFTFEYLPFGHQPEGWYRNPRTGDAPASIVSGVGIVPVTWYPAREFFPFFPVS